MPWLLALGLVVASGCSEQGGRAIAAAEHERCIGGECREVSPFAVDEAREAVEVAREDYRRAEADLAYHLGTFGAALDHEQRVRFANTFWQRADHAAEHDAYRDGAEHLRDLLLATDVDRMLSDTGLDAISSAPLVSFLDGLRALAETPYAPEALERLAEVREWDGGRGAGLSELFMDAQEQQEIVAVAVEHAFVEVLVEGRPWLSGETAPWSPEPMRYDPSLAFGEIEPWLDRPAFSGWGVAQTRQALLALWAEDGGSPEAYVTSVDEYIKSQDPGPVGRTTAFLSAMAAIVPYGRSLSEGAEPPALIDALGKLRTMTWAAGSLHRGFQPMIQRMGEHSRWIERVASPTMGQALGLVTSGLTLGLDTYAYATQEDRNVYDTLSLVGSVVSTGGAVATALGQAHVGIAGTAIGLPLKLFAGHLADEQRYREARERLYGESVALLQSLGLPERAAATLGKAHPDAIQILRGSASPNGITMALEPQQIQSLAQSNAELFFDPAVRDGYALDSEQADDRALVLAALVDAWVLLPEQVVPFVQDQWRPATGYSDELRSALDSIGNQVDLPSLVTSADPIGVLRYVADGMEARNNPGHVELHRFIDALDEYY